MIDVDDPITTCGIFASVASGATASAVGVGLYPSSATTLLLTTSSCAMRFAWSGTPPSSRTITSTGRPAMTAGLRSWKSFTAASICLPFSANGPVMGAEKPILIGCWAYAVVPAVAANSATTTAAR